MIKILIVDDEEIIQKAMEKAFSKYGSCTVTGKGLEALKFYQEAFDSKEPFDLIILDYSLEDLSGLDILKEIRDNEREHQIPKKERSKIIMATGNNEAATVKECISAGCNNYILKPLKPKIVEEKLSKLGIVPIGEEEPTQDATEPAGETEEGNTESDAPEDPDQPEDPEDGEN